MCLKWQVANQNFPHDGSERSHFVGDPPKGERSEHGYLYLSLIQNLVEVNGLLLYFDLLDLKELGVCKEVGQESVGCCVRSRSMHLLCLLVL